MSKPRDKIYHYTYRITNIEDSRFYIGCRSCCCEPYDDLGVHYFSSSTDKIFMAEQKTMHESFIYEIIAIFNNRESAIKLEIELHNYYNVGVNELFYNKAKQTVIGFDTTGIPGIKLFGKANPMYGKKHTKETKKYLSEIAKGNTNWLGKFHSEETKKCLSEQRKGKKQKIVSCPYCNKIGGISLMKRYHFNNCKYI